MKPSSRLDRQRLVDALADVPELAGTLELVWRQALASFPPAKLALWVEACRELAASGLGGAAALAYARNAPACAAGAGPDAALAVARVAPRLAARVGGHAAIGLIVAAPRAARRIATTAGFLDWLRVVERVAEAAPEAVTLLLDRTEIVLAELDVRAFEAWALEGLRAAAGDREKRLKFFALLDPRARRLLSREGDTVQFSTLERQLKAYVMALWRLAPPLRAAGDSDGDRPGRASFAAGLVRVPASFPGMTGAAAAVLYRAALAHIGAHLRFGKAPFPVGSLKPMQVALVSLIEDARVEQLALQLYPGLLRLWLPFHVALPAGLVTGPALFARLSRALIDPAYEDEHGWVRKGRDLFFGAREGWQDPGISRSIGGLLGNDLGQMRVQFNAKTYAVEPPYRDDNHGLWDIGESGSAAAADIIDESVRFERLDHGGDADRQRQAPARPPADEPFNRAALAPVDDGTGIPVARYPEWDYLIGQDRPDWTTLVEYCGIDGRAATIDGILERHRPLVARLTALISAAKVSRPQRLRRQPDGDRLDLESCIDAAISHRLGHTPDPKVYAKLERRFRDLSVLLLLDVSQSTNDIVRGVGRSILELEREAAALLAHAMTELGDPFAIHAFCSDGRADVRYCRVKDFDAPYDVAARRRLAGLGARFSTRIGAALRHAGREIAGRRSHRRLLLAITDGEPSDVDVADRRYLAEDARRAVLALAHRGVDVFCVGLDAGGDSHLERIFGRRNVMHIDRIERLPSRLPMLYLRLTA
jgi:nitric oxide reductase NorD protein